MNLSDEQREFWHARLSGHLTGLFAGAGLAALAELEAHAEWVSLRGGETLFRRGEPGDAAYVVVSGRLRAVDDRDGERRLNDIGVGETVGEMALLSPDRRSATVYAVRDSLLARLPAEDFHRMIEHHPHVLRRISTLLVRRLRKRDGTQLPTPAAAGTIAVVPAGTSVNIEAFARRLAAALVAHGATRRLDADCVREAIGVEGDADNPRVVQWLNEQELAHRFVLYESGPRASEWARRAVRQADHVLLVADAEGSPLPGEVESDITSEVPSARAPRRSLVLLRPTASAVRPGTGEFLAHRRVDSHYHIALDQGADFARLARCLTGNGIGLALSGGGARGFAHLGVLRALAEAGVPIDWVCGTSSGAFVAALAAQRLPPEAAYAQCAQQFSSLRDPTLPVIALLAGRRIHAGLERAFGTLAIEDLPLPFFCVSTNLSRASQSVHERGSLLRAIRASLSLPGVLPPVSIAQDLHVDGGLVNNLPIDVLATKPEIGSVIAVDVSAEVEMRAPEGLTPEISGWRLLAQRLNPWAERSEMPSIMSLLTRSALVASVHWARERGSASSVSLYLRIPVADLRLLAFDRIDEIAARGYQATRDAIRAWWRERAG